MMEPGRLRPEELREVMDWAEREGWNPGLDDASAFYQSDPEGFFAARIDGNLVAAISVVNHSDQFAFLGLYICRPAYRGQGIGFALWQYAMQHAGPRTLGLDGVSDQQDNYCRSGFVHAGATLRFEGRIPGAAHPDLRRVAPGDIPELTRLEAAANGYSKARFLAEWLCDTATRKTLVLVSAGKCAGFATVRECQNGFKVGPLVAGSLTDAKVLLRGAAEFAGAGPVVLDVPADMTQLTGCCREFGMTVSFQTVRMYKGQPPAPGSQIRSVATLELG